MKEYHKINTIYKRDQKGKILLGQYADEAFEYLANNQWEFTEKVDGTNIRIMWDGKTVTFGGKTDNASIPQFLVNKLNETFQPIAAREKLKEVFKDAKQACLYGEGYGAKIQNGGNYIPDGQDFILFDVWADGWWLQSADVLDVATKLSLKTVPIIGHGTLTEAESKVKEGIRSAWGDFIAEGIVARPTVPLYKRNGERVITKIKHKDFA